MSAQILPLKKPAERDADGVLYVPPPLLASWHGLRRFRQVAREISQETMGRHHQILRRTHVSGRTVPADWKTAMFVARVRARKYGFRVVDLSEQSPGRGQ